MKVNSAQHHELHDHILKNMPKESINNNHNGHKDHHAHMVADFRKRFTLIKSGSNHSFYLNE